MGDRWRWGRTMAIGVLAAGLIAVAAGIAYGAGVSSQISVCVHRNGGALYKAKKCAKHDSKLTWNTVGPSGTRGLTGAAGGPGTSGFAGETPGANGAIAGYGTSAEGPVTINLLRRPRSRLSVFRQATTWSPRTSQYMPMQRPPAKPRARYVIPRSAAPRPPQSAAVTGSRRLGHMALGLPGGGR